MIKTISRISSFELHIIIKLILFVNLMYIKL